MTKITCSISIISVEAPSPRPFWFLPQYSFLWGLSILFSITGWFCHKNLSSPTTNRFLLRCSSTLSRISSRSWKDEKIYEYVSQLLFSLKMYRNSIKVSQTYKCWKWRYFLFKRFKFSYIKVFYVSQVKCTEHSFHFLKALVPSPNQYFFWNFSHENSLRSYPRKTYNFLILLYSPRGE